jgi:hypothetical protein
VDRLEIGLRIADWGEIMRRTLTVGVVGLLVASCGGDIGEPPTAAENSTTTVVTTSPPTTTVVTDLEATEANALATMVMEGLRYHDFGEPFADKSGAIDVVAPTEGDGPWPTVVVFHGDPKMASKTWHRYDAQLLAEQGRVVFVANWGHGITSASDSMSEQDLWKLGNQQVACAVVYAHANTAEFGGDPDHITLYGYSAGANQILMAGLADFGPLDTCLAPGPAVAVQALVPVDADWVLGGGWGPEAADSESFYLKTPWRYLDGSQDIPIHITVVEDPTDYFRSVEPDPATSWLSQRHTDIDLAADLEQRGYLADGKLYLKESSEYAYEILTELGYDASWVVMTGSHHDSWSDEGRAIVVETVLNAERK